MRIGMLGGTGPAGKSLGSRLASVGFDVVLGSRSADRAADVCTRLAERWPGRTLSIKGADNAGAADADVVIIATPWDGAAETAMAVSKSLSGKLVISMANALAKVAGEFEPLVPPRGSVAGHVQAAVPDALVAAAFHHIPAKELGDLDDPVDSDVLICSDHPGAIETTAEIVSAIPGLRPLDAGQLSNATPIEAFTAVLLQLNLRYKTRVALKLTGINLEP